MSAVAKAVVRAVGGVVIVVASAPAVWAGCVVPSVLAGQQPSDMLSWAGRASYAAGPAMAHGATGSSSIVGMWQFTFTSKGNDVAPLFIPDNAPLDAGYAQWHSDGTEIMNSGRDPATSNFCLGVWEQVGPRTFRLNHFALSWDNTGKLCTPEAGAPSCFVGPTNIREEVTVDRQGMAYTGQVTIDQYDTQQNLKFRLHGTVAGHRITAH